MSKKKDRLDMLVVKRGLAENADKAKRLIMAAKVLVDGHPVTKAGECFPLDVPLGLKASSRFVSRGGEKLEQAFKKFDLDVTDSLCIDVGSSTGGFTDCLLQHGARHVLAVDVGKGQLHWDLRNDPRVTCMEQVNARNIVSSDISEAPDIAVFDVSFISLTLVMPPVIQIIKSEGLVVTLIKPQFEAKREQVEKGGVVRSAEVHQEVIDRIKKFGTENLGLEWLGICESPIKGPAGNIEFLAFWRCGDHE